jgi:hypothetical protein
MSALDLLAIDRDVEFADDFDTADSSDEPSPRDFDRARAELGIEALLSSSPDLATRALMARFAELIFSRAAEGPLGMRSPVRLPTAEEQSQFFAAARDVAWRLVHRLPQSAIDDRAALIYRRDCGAA